MQNIKCFLILVFTVLMTSLLFSQSSTQSSSSNVSIPDQGTNYRSLSFSGLPSNAQITSVSYDIRFCHDYWGDIASRLDDTFAATGGQLIVSSSSSNNASGCGYNFAGTTSVFNGESPNKTFYVRAWDDGPSDVGYIDYVSLTVNYTVPINVTSVTPSSANLGQSKTFTISGSNLINGMAWYIDDFGNGTVNSNSSTTQKQFTTTGNWSAGVKSGEIKDQPGGTVLENFTVTLNFSTPTNPSASVQGSQHINLSWNSVNASGTFQYRLYRSTSSSSSSATQIYCGSSTSYTDQGSHLNPNTTYYYWVRHCNSNESCGDLTPTWCSNYSGSTVATTVGPNVISVSPTSTNLGQSQTFTINGSNLINGMAWYIDDFGNGTVNSNSSTTQKQFTTTGNWSAGVKSGEIKDQPGGTTLENFTVTLNYLTPSSPTISVQGSQSINLSWASVSASGTFQYRLFRNTVNNFSTATQIHCADTQTSYLDSGSHLSAGTTYYYWIQTCNNDESCGDFTPTWCSNVSSSASGTTTGSSAPTVSSVTPLIGTVGQSTTFTLTGQNLPTSTAWYIDDFGSGTVNSSSSTTTKTFTTTPNYNAGVKSGEIKDQSGGTVLHNFDVTVNYSIPIAPVLTVQGEQSINVSWSAVAALGNFQYRLYRNTSNDFATATQIFCADDQTMYSDAGTHLNAATTYYYWIRHCNTNESCGNFNPIWCSSESPSSNATTTTTSGPCTYSDVDSQTPWASTAATYLCNEGILDDDGMAEPADILNRAALSKMLYFAIDLDLNGYVQGTVHNFPSPFNDLQNTNLWDYYYAKTLSYLEYDGDCTTPFDRNAFNFYRGEGIERKYLVKAILETFDIDVSSPTGSEPFTDVDANTDAYNYILQAYNDGIIAGANNAGVNFYPDNLALRAEAFVMLYNALQTYGVPAVSNNDFYEPGNYTPQNMAQASGGHSGNFNFYTKTSFAISSIGLPLNFGHTYNSYLGDLPKEFFRMQALGNGWSHSYNTYLMEISGSEPADSRVVQMLPNGTLHIYKEIGNNYEAETAGVYADLNRITGNIFHVTTKSQVVFTYEKVNHTNTFGSTLYILKRIQDRNNNTVTLTYENAVTQSGMSRLKSVTGSAGRNLFFYYHANTDRIQRVTDPINRNIYYNYTLGADGNYTLTGFINANGDNTTYNYGTTECDANLLYSITLPKGNTVTNGYQNRKLTSTQTNGGNVTNFSRNFSHGLNGTTVATMTDIADYGMVSTNYDENAVPTSVITQSSTVNMAYGNSDNPTKPTNISSSSIIGSVSYFYDNNGNLLQMNLPYGITHSFTYNGFNDILTYTNPESKQWSYSYNANGNLDGVTSSRGTTNYTRQSNGLVTQVTNPSNIVVAYGYDTYGNVTSTTIPAEGISTSASYDAASRVQSMTNPNGQATTYVFDANDNLLSNTFAGAYTKAYEYDDNDNLTKITNARGYSTNLTYEFNNDFHTGTSFEGMNDSYTYLQDGRLSSKTDPKNMTFNYLYDGEKRLTDIVSPNDNVEYVYDGRDNITSVENVNGTIYFTYDDINRVTQTTDTYGNQVGYEYFKDGQIKRITYPGNKVVNYTYYGDNLLHTVTDWNGNTTTYAYRDDGLLSQITYPNNTNCTYTYDGAGRNTTQTWSGTGGATIFSYTRTFDPYGNIIQEATVNPFTATMPANQSINYTHNSKNQIQNAGTTNTSFKADGTALTKGSQYTYTFDDYERLTNISGGMTASFTYDALGHRRKKTVNGTTTRFVLDILGMSKVLMEQSSSGAVQNYYVYGLTLISRIGSNGTTTHYYHGDYRGSTVAMTNATGTTTHQYAYGAYGQNYGIQEPAGDSNSFRYVGMYGVQYEADDVYFMRARYYDSELGRFLSEDPVWHTNLYNYADGNPISYIDPEGKDAGFWFPSPKEYLIYQSLSSFHQKIFRNYTLILGTTDVNLTKKDFKNIVNQARELGVCDMEGDSDFSVRDDIRRVSVKLPHNTNYGQALGSIDLFITKNDKSQNCEVVGLYDSYDFNPKHFPTEENIAEGKDTRSWEAEFATRAIYYGIYGTSFKIYHGEYYGR